MRRLIPATVLAVLLIFAPGASAATFVVNNAADPDNTAGACAAAGTCSLRQAVNAANATITTPDTITFAPGLTSVTITNVPSNAGVRSTSPVTIDGGGIVTVNGVSGFHILSMTNFSGGNISSTVKGITLQGITNGDSGAGVLVEAIDPAEANVVTLDHVTVRNNTVVTGGNGGGVLAISGGTTVNIVDSTVANNHAPGASPGAGVAVVAGAVLNVTRSTIANNSPASLGGGIHVAAGSGAARVTNSTITGNSASLGGGIYDDANLIELSYNTISGNTAGAGNAGVEISAGSGAKLKGNIISGNTPAQCKTASTPTSLGFNFFADNSCGTGVNDHPSTAVALGTLQDNGGPTQTQALPAGSPAIDAGGLGGCTTVAVTALATDQRGTARPQGPACDSGAFEALFAQPSNTAAPVISGEPAVGQLLTCSQGSWAGGTPQTYGFAWRRDGAAIAGATGSTYTVTTEDAGHALTCVVTATNSAGSASAESSAVSVPAAGGGGSGGGGGGGGGGGADVTAPIATLTGKGTQDVDKLALTVGSNEGATASGQASVKVPAGKKPVTSKTATANLPANGTAKLKFKFKKKTLKTIKKQIKKGKKPKAKVSITVTDVAGNSSTATKSVKLKD